MEAFTNIITSVKEFLLSVLPLSPFADWIDQFSNLPFLGYLNWFIPVGTFIAILELWLVAYGAYLVYSIILRWAKVSGS